MIRVKNFNSTGVAPDGRLYAGDLLAIQDAAAGLSNFAQTIDLATVRIGDSAIQLTKFGTLDARITAALRTDGILRGLGGLYAGTFTTAQRDAIAAGSRPFGLEIMNTTTNRREINLGSDAVPNWQASGAISAIDYVQRTTSVTINSNNGNSPIDVLDGSSLAYQAGNYWVEFFAPEVHIQDINHVLHVDVWDSTTRLGEIMRVANPIGFLSTFGKTRITLSAATHQIRIRAWAAIISDGINAGSGAAGGLSPMWMQVTKA